MCIRNRALSLIYKLILLIVCGFGLLSYTGVFEGRFDASPFKYYTILSNLLVFLFTIFAAVYVGRRLARDGVKGYATYAPQVKGAVVMAITVTMLIYQFILAPSPFSMSATDTPLRNNIVHLVVPLMVIGDWLLFDHKGRWRVFSPFVWEVIPLAYWVYTIAAAALGVYYVGGARYPYGFINPDVIGWQVVLRNVGLLCLAFLALGYLFWAIDALLGRMAAKKATGRPAVHMPSKGASVPSGIPANGSFAAQATDVRAPNGVFAKPDILPPEADDAVTPATTTVRDEVHPASGTEVQNGAVIREKTVLSASSGLEDDVMRTHTVDISSIKPDSWPE